MHQHDFFGRDALIDKLTSTLASTLQTERPGKQSARLLAIIGPSGSGKSSVMMAGLLPRLRHGGLPGSEAWIYLDPIVPGAHPVESLALALAERLPDRSLFSIRQDLEEDSARGLHLLATTLTQSQSTRLLLYVDQFEELFTQTSAQEEREQFHELFITALSEPRGPVIVILTLRADFYDRVLSSSVLCPLIEQHQCAIPPMNVQDLARALFLRLIEPGVTEQDTTRRRAARSELLLADPKETALLEEVSEAFIRARLVTSTTMAGTIVLEVSHEALIREWPRLASWLQEAREDIRLHRQLAKTPPVGMNGANRGADCIVGLNSWKRKPGPDATVQAGTNWPF
jgi:hypothetical protein